MRLSRELILDYLEEAGKPVYEAVIFSDLEVTAETTELFYDIINALEYTGKIIKTKKNKYALPEKMGLILGKMISSKKGFGFVRPDLSSGERTGDIFIPLREMNTAMDGDIVSATPEILIKINDENRYLTMDDPDLVSVYLSRQGDTEEQRIEMYDSLSNQQLFWTPSTLPDNIAQMKYVPQRLKDGVYNLRVGVTDASLNESGKNYYQITFEVINKSTITQVLNYPNPFSTATHFVFTLTGSEVPDEIVVQIMTVSGKVVKEINLSEVATITIGRNITDYAWDGKDRFGDLLANGVYFYRVIIKNEGDEFEKRETDIDKFFKNGIGKMYLLR